MTLEELFAGAAFDLDAAQARLARLAEEEGLEWGVRTHTYNSRLAQELAKWAEAHGGGSAIHDVLFRAYFVDGINLAEIPRLIEVAASVGLSGDGARAALQSGSERTSVDADWRRAAALGVTGVPTFVMNGRGIVGAQSYDVLADFVERAGALYR